MSRIDEKANDLTLVATQRTPDRYARPVADATSVGEAATANPGRWGRRRRTAVLVVLVIGLVITVLAAIGSQVLHDQTEDRLLEQRSREAATVFSIAIARNQSAIGSAGRLVSNGLDTDEFRAVMEPITGTGQPFIGVSVWSVDGPAPRLVFSVGQPLVLSAAPPDRIAEVLGKAMATPGKMSVADFINNTPRRIGYAFVADQPTKRFAVYAESALSPKATSVPRTDEAFKELDYALYLNDEVPRGLMVSSLAKPPITTRRQVASTAFGDAKLVLITTPRENLAGTFSALLPWLVAGFGLLVSLSSAAVADRMLRRRDEAFRLAEENSRLYSEQRQIAETLQRSLLPQSVVSPLGTKVAARYWPAGAVSEVGGDFYDVFPLDDQRWAFVIGDVCGKGIEAAALTSVARHTIRAAAQHVRSPAEVLRWVHQAVLTYDPTTYCTACYGVLTAGVDGRADRFEFALGGHAQPLLAAADGTTGPIGTPGTLLGMVRNPGFTNYTVELRPGDMLFLYTDGLTDAHDGEAVDVDELEVLVGEGRDGSPDELADQIRSLLDLRRPVGGGDDTALLIVQVG